jgi:DNA-binding NarL/FixJ family response regulator
VPKILIAEDEVVFVMELEEILGSAGYEVAGTAFSGLEAVAMARKLKPDLILMDLKMPGELDGIEAAGEIAEELSIPVIFVTGHTEKSFLNRAKNVPSAGYIVKPFHEAQIRAVIDMALQRHSSQDEQKDFSASDNTASSPVTVFESASKKLYLTQGELKVAILIQSQKKTKEIVDILGLGKETVLWHRKNIRRKLNLKKGESLVTRLRSYTLAPSD